MLSARTYPVLVVATLGWFSSALASETELVIYPGFTKAELERSVRATLRAADRCATRATPRPASVKKAVAPYVSATRADGLSVQLHKAELELRCRAEPLRRCEITYVGQEGLPDLAYASIQCFGSHGSESTSFLVTSTLDLRKARKEGVRGTRKDRAIHKVGLSFQTDEFPGTHLAAAAELRRLDRSVVVPTQVQRFDDYQSTDKASLDTLPAARLLELSQEVMKLACRLVDGCPSEDSPSTAAED